MSTKVTAPNSPLGNNEIGERTLEVEFDYGETLDDKIDLFGESVCNSKLDQKIRIDVQAYLRGKLSAAEEDGSPKFTDEQIIESLKSWKLGEVSRVKKSKGDKALDLWNDADPDEQKDMLQKIVAAKKLKEAEARS